MFKNRTNAGELLAQKLKQFKNNTVVLAIPRGGVPVAASIAKIFHLPLALALVKKIGHPSNKEFAIGAASLTDYYVNLNNGIPDDYIAQEVAQVRKRLLIMQEKFHHDFTALELKNKIVLLVDDGMATGHTALQTVQLLRNYNPKKIILATPVASLAAVILLQNKVDKLIVLEVSSSFQSVSFFYQDFKEVSDDEVIKLLNAMLPITSDN
jgi:predicted phosphoribosyltransferase